MRRELGSEFWEVPVREAAAGLFPGKTQWFQSGRSALLAILRDVKRKRRVRTAALPSWCCDSMIKPFLQEQLEVRFYPVYREGGRLRVEPRTDCDVILLLDYFGYHSSIEAEKGLVIRDLTHSVFSDCHNDAEYCFGSLRKWCGFRTGGFAWGPEDWAPEKPEADASYVSLREAAMSEKAAYIAGASHSKDYLEKFREAEELLEACSVRAAAPQDIALAERLDAAFIRQRRRENARVLLDALGQYAVFPELGETDVPLFVPVMVPERDALRRYLTAQEIYCPVHWPISPLHSTDGKTGEIYAQELSLVCDQRYGAAEMHRIAEAVRKGMEKC